MSSDFAKMQQVFLAAVELHQPDDWDAYLEEACAGDEELRGQVAMLLKAHAAGGGPPGRAALANDRTVIYQPLAEGPGTIIGPYKLLEQIGEGGFGVVFMAEQQQPVRRRVALKVVKPGMDTRQVIARFEAERQALALMDHPNIAKVLDGGAIVGGPGGVSSGRPYFVMELVKGVPITDYCDQNQVSIRERLELFVHVCQAVQHAHQKGIIHRDIKPTNVLVASHEGVAVAKIIDFGIAKAVGLSALDVDTRSDVYSLGVLLYELLTGTTPFDKERFKQAEYDEIRRIIREEEPPKPSSRISTLANSRPHAPRAETGTRSVPSTIETIATQRKSDPKRLTQLVRGELDWIVMRCLEKDRNRRYETASALAADVQHYLRDEPVAAGPPSAWYKVRKFARRQKRALAMAACVVLAFAGLAGGIGWAVRDRAAREAKASNDLERALERAELFQGQGKRAEALAALERAELLASEAALDPALKARHAALKERLDAEARDQEFVARFEQIRLRVQSEVDLKESHFDRAAALPKIREALRQYGIAIDLMAAGEAAACLEGKPDRIRRNVLAALDEYLRLTPKPESQTRQWLLATLAAAEAHRPGIAPALGLRARRRCLFIISQTGST
jgi:serine/threonine protein kinase